MVRTIQELENFFRSLTLKILGLDPDSPDEVRISWQTEGSPAWNIAKDYCFMRVTISDDPASKCFDYTYTNNSDNLNQNVNYIRVVKLDYILYGPNSFERAEQIKNLFYTSRDIKSKLDLNKFGVIQDINIPQRVPELFNGQWWERIDYSISFNELVSFDNTIENIQTINMNMKGQ